MSLTHKVGGWKPQELTKLRREYPFRSTSQIAKELGRSVDAVYKRSQLMGLKKETLLMRERFLDEVMAEYANSTAPEIAARRGVSVWAVRMWIREARHGIANARTR